VTCYVLNSEYSMCDISCQAGWLCTTTTTTTTTTTATTTANLESSINISSFYNNLYFIFNTNILAHSSCHTSFNTGISGLTLFNISCTGINNAVNFTFYGNFISIK
jgi:hypothetical protein